MLVARAYASTGQLRGVLDVLSRAEESCGKESVEAKAEGRGKQRGGGSVPAAHFQPPAELYEVVARALARSGMWEEAASAVRRLEVGTLCCDFCLVGLVLLLLLFCSRLFLKCCLCKRSGARCSTWHRAQP